MKLIKIRTRDDYVTTAATVSFDKNSHYHPDKLIPYLNTIPFQISNVVTIQANNDNFTQEHNNAKQWLADNVDTYHIEPLPNTRRILRVFFSNEADALRFAWIHDS